MAIRESSPTAGPKREVSLHRIDPRKALLAAALCWAGFLAIVILVRTGKVADFDAFGLQFWRTGADLRPAGPPWLLEAVRDVTALGGVLLRNVIAIGAVVALLFLRLRKEATWLAATVISGWLANSLLKLTIGRVRPEVVPHLTEASGMSFPSGHSFNAAVVFLSIALTFAALSQRQCVRLTLIGSAIVLTLLIAISRVWLGVHFPSDVAAGWLGGAAWAFTASALLHRPAKVVAEPSR